MLPQHHGDAHAAEGKGDGAGGGSADDAQSRAGNQQINTQKGNIPGGVDQQKIQHHIDDIHPDAHLHGGLGIAGGPEGGTQNDGSRPGQHGQIQNEEIGGGQIPDIFVHLHPHRHQTA